MLASGLTDQQAREREHAEIAALDKPFNAAGPVRPRTVSGGERDPARSAR